MNTEKLISNVIAILFMTSIFLIAFTWIIFDFNKSQTSLKDSLTVASAFFGGITTLAAAYIASKLVFHWRDQEIFNHKRQLFQEGIQTLREIAILLNDLKRTYNPLNSKNFSNRLKLIDKSFNISQDLLISYKVDYLNVVESDKKLLQIYEYCDDFYNLIKDITQDLNNVSNQAKIQSFEKKFAHKVDIFINSIHDS